MLRYPRNWAALRMATQVASGASRPFTTQAPHSPRAQSFEACVLHLEEEEVPPNKDPRDIIREFRQAINMGTQELEAFLASKESRQAAAVGTEADRQGRHMARRIIELLTKDDGAGETFYEGDYIHMHQVAAYVNCHKEKAMPAAQGADASKGAQFSTPERYHLMNFGFDPLKAAGM